MLLVENDKQVIRWRGACPPPAFTEPALLDIEEPGQGRHSNANLARGGK